MSMVKMVEEIADTTTSDIDVGDPLNSTSLSDNGINTTSTPLPTQISNEDGDGSKSQVDEYVDEMGIEEGDGRSTAETYFNPSKAPQDKRGKFERLYKIQQGERVNDGNRRQRTRIADRKRDASVVSSQLKMTKTDKESLMEFIETYDFNGVKFEKTLLAAVSLLCNRRDRRVREEETWVNIRESYNVTPKGVRQERAKLSRECAV